MADWEQFVGPGVAAGAATLAVGAGRNALEDVGTDLAKNYDAITGDIESAATFKPYTVTGTSGGGTYGQQGFTLDPNATQQGFLNQANAMRGAMGMSPDMTQALSGYGSGALTQSRQALGADSGAGATALGGEYAGMATDLMGTQTPEDLAQLQSLFAQQAQQGQQVGSLGGLTDQLQAQALSGLGQETQSAGDIYNQIRAMQSPEEERQRIAMENRLAAQGRLGVSTAAYGGTPEQLAMAKAQEEAKNAASLQAIGMADQLATSQQARASQLAQLGMSAEQIDSQLATEGLGRQTTSAGLAANLAQTGAGIQSQQQQLGQGLAGLGLQATQLGGQLGQQDIANAASLFGLGQQSSLLPSQIEGAQLANINQALSASNVPFQQQLAASQLGLTAQGQQNQLEQSYANLLANAGLSEAGLLRDLALSGSTLEQEYIKTLGNIGAGLAGVEPVEAG
jgi:hypothetical protein